MNNHATTREATSSNDMVETVQRYLAALDRGDLESMKRLFTADGIVHSAFLGEMPARTFFDRLATATTRNDITVIDVLPSATGQRRVAAYFRYLWHVKDGGVIDFKCVDVFDFDDTAALIRRMTVVADTHPIRVQHGNKYGD